MTEAKAISRQAQRLAEAFKNVLKAVELVRESGEAEYGGFLNGLEGGFVEPGPAGSLTRGKLEILPTGRNFFAVDPTQMPTPAAWEIGVQSAKKLLEYYLKEEGRYPESVGEVLWSKDAYRADGEQLAQILYLIGVRPVWDSGGSVRGVEPIPLEELGRPRIDVLVRISGIVRDTLPNYVHLIDEAVAKVVALDEPLEVNYVKKHYLENLLKLKAEGVEGDVEEMAKARVFAEPPGAYGAGVNYAVEASAWRTDEDLAKVWIQWSSYMYTRRSYGKPAPEALMLNLRYVDVVNRNHESDEFDIFGCCCYYSYHGGFYNAAKAVSGKNVKIVTVDTRDVSNVEVRDMREEVERVVRAKLLNPVWISEMKKHGYRGANEFQRKILHLYGWSATAKVVEKWVFDEIAKTYILDPEMRKWFLENNPWAAEEVARRLIEAAQRGLWKADKDLLDKLREAYGEIEGVLEEEVGEGEVQGGSIEIYTAEDVDVWKNQETVKKIEKLWIKLR
ncbi:cobaltochelatase subunit CobN [Pyrobaculum neutrophilum]|uniref:cobaltochelatase subunit CobN n=1 Tax=Pyrobaculum neutrophilum TaxID=70771 RepID=UPI0001618FCB|nr:cobaltochelatase subunit CobN [Pyrobaculum neutrophilum]